MKTTFSSLHRTLMGLSLLALSTTASWAQSTITAQWPFSQGTANPTQAEVSADDVLSSSTFTFGANLEYNATPTQSVGGMVFSQIHPIVSTANAKTPGADDHITFSVKPKKGITFTPTKISFKAAKLGTNGGSVDIDYAVGNGDAVSLAKQFSPQRNNATPPYSEISYDITGAQVTDQIFQLTIHIYNLANTKALALRDVTIEGTYTGSAIEVPSYTLQTSLSDEAAGSITTSPAGTTFDEGTELQLTALENFSYHFSEWVDENGKTVSTQNPYSFTIQANTSLQAVYTKNNAYALNLNFEGGAISNQVSLLPAGVMIDGVRYYEEGTQVKLTASNNYILTFTHWEDNSTAPERTLTMQADQNITAHYSACDYIVGWDFMQDEPTSERAGDYKSETDNAGLFSHRREDGTTKSWLRRGINSGAYGGHYCACSWAPLADNYYYQISFSTQGYSNVKVKASLGDDYNAYSIQNWEYSTDGVNFTHFGQSDPLPNRGWVTNEFALPAEVSNRPIVYVRFISDTTSPLVGVTGTQNGLGITDIFVTADKEIIDDTTAPVLVSSIPSNQATGVSANGSIVLTFDEKVVAGTGAATLAGETLNATFSGKTVVFAYTALAYDHTYTFHLPAGVIVDRSGNPYEGCDITFTTLQRTQPEARLYDAVVAQDGTGDYTTVQAAIDAAPSGRVQPYLIFIKAGLYKEHVDIPASKTNLHLIGQGYDVVSISDGLLCGGDNAYSVDKGATVVDHASNGYFEGISFVNSYGKEMNNGPQALALYTMGDRIILNKCGLISYQDTWLTTKTVNYRHYVKDCFIEGAVDFIYGQGNVYFDACTINIVRKSGGYIVAPNHAPATTWGYVFMNNTITAPGVPSETSVWLGRPWHDSPKTVFINTIAEVTIPAAGWYQTMGGIPSIWADYNTMDAKGNPVDLSHRNNYYYYTDGNGNKVEGYAKNYLTDEEAATYTIKNVLGGSDNWQPVLTTEACAAPKPSYNAAKTSIAWEAVPYAICYVVTCNGKVVGFTTDCTFACTAQGTYKVQAANEFGGLSEAGEATLATSIQSLQSEGAAPVSVEVYGANGQRLQTPGKGVNIVRYYMSNGEVRSQKVFK